MDRREMLGVVGAATAGLAFIPGSEARGEPGTSNTGNGYAECSCQGESKGTGMNGINLVRISFLE